MALRHIAVFALLGVAFLAWTAHAKRKEAAARRAQAEAGEIPRSHPKG